MKYKDDRRIGTGLDIHPLVKGEFLIVGGVKIPSRLKSHGHSDGDALIHSIVDSLLGALCLGDIGSNFPSDDKKWKNTEGKLFLSITFDRIKKNGWDIENIDSTVLLQTPKIIKFVPKIRHNLSKILAISVDKISVKATTTDYLGFIGEKRGWGAQTTVLLKNNNLT